MKRNFPKSRKLILLIGDIILMIFSSIITINLFAGKELITLDKNLYSGMIPIMVVLMGVLFNVNGLFTLERKRYTEILLSLATAMFNLSIVIMAITFFIREFSYSRGILIVSVFLQFITIAFWKYFYWSMEKKFMINYRIH